jgi:hypothetical protein
VGVVGQRVRLGSEWRSFRQAWQALPENPLWLLRQRQQANAGQTRRRQARLRLILWSGVGLLVWGTALWLMLGLQPFSSSIAEWMSALIYLIAGPAIVALLSTVVQLTQRAQSWLAPERLDAKRAVAAQFDPLLGLTPLAPAEVVAAALRDLAPLILGGTGLAAVTTLVIIVGSRLESMPSRDSLGLDQLATALVFSPLTLAALMLVGCLGATVLTLVFLCLGLGQRSQVQRASWTFAAVAHQLLALPLSFGYMAQSDFADERNKHLMLLVLALGLTAAVLALAAGLAFRGRRLVPGWLPGLPGGLVLGGLIAFIMLEVVSLGRSSYHDEFAMATLFQCIAWWSSLSLASPGCVPLLACYGEVSGIHDAEHLVTSINFVLTLLVQGCLLVGAYRCALLCAARRLCAGE